MWALKQNKQTNPGLLPEIVRFVWNGVNANEKTGGLGAFASETSCGWLTVWTQTDYLLNQKQDFSFQSWHIYELVFFSDYGLRNVVKVVWSAWVKCNVKENQTKWRWNISHIPHPIEPSSPDSPGVNALQIARRWECIWFQVSYEKESFHWEAKSMSFTLALLLV